MKPVHPHSWLWETLEGDPTFILRSMFGAKAVYAGGRLLFCFCDSEEPWRGMLVCTDKERHAAILADHPDLVPHPILPKWLYLRESLDSFERTATALVRLARSRDPRIGVTPGAKRPRRRKTA